MWNWCARLRAPRGSFRRAPARAPREPPLRSRRASDVAAERRGASLRLSAAWHLADAPWAARALGPAVWEPRGPPPPAPGPASALCLRPQSLRPACLQLHALGPPLSPARRRAPSGWGAWTLESPFGATSVRGKEPGPRGLARMEVPGGSDPSGDGAGDGAHPDPRAPGAAAPSSGPCTAARESERQLRLRLCVLNEILGTERDYVGTLRFLQSVSVSQRARGQRSAGASARSGPHNLWPRSLGVARVASGASAGDAEK